MAEEMRRAVKDMLELSKFYERETKRGPEIMEIREGSKKHKFVEFLKKMMDNIPEEELETFYEHADLLAAGLQNLRSHHIPGWYFKGDELPFDAQERIKKMVANLGRLRPVLENVPKKYRKDALAVYIQVSLLHPVGPEKGLELISKIAERGKWNRLKTIWSIGLVSRNSTHHLEEIISKDMLGEHEEEILDKLEEAVWRIHESRKHKEPHQIAMKVTSALSKVEDPALLKVKIPESRNGKEPTLLEEIKYHLGKMAEEPEHADYHAQKIQKAVGTAIDKIISQRRRKRG